MSRRSALRCAGAAVAAVTLAAPAGASAADFAVTNGADAGAGSLRDAIAQANAASNRDTITFTAAHAVIAASALPALDQPVLVRGGGGVVRGSDLVLDGDEVAVSALGVEPPNRIVAPSPAAPTGLAVQRLSDRNLRLSGTAPAAGALEAFAGGGGRFLTRFDGGAAGPFALPLPDLPAGDRVTMTLTTGGNTSSFAEPVLLEDVTSPVLVAARTVDGNSDGRAEAVRLGLSEPVADASGFGGLALEGAGAVGTGPAADDSELEASLAAPQPGDAQPAVRVAANGSLADAAGNQVLAGAPAIVAADGVAPQPSSAVALSRVRIRVRFGEPVSGAVAPGEVELTMGGEPRTVTRVTMAPDGRSLELDADRAWAYGTAGAIRLRSELADAAGNRSGADRPAIRVFAAPGDTAEPVLRRVRLARAVVCVKRVSRRCRDSGGTVAFRVSEPATIAVDVRRRGSAVTSSLRRLRPAGEGRVGFGARIEGRRLLPGTYTLTVFAIDTAGNESPPVELRLRVRR